MNHSLEAASKMVPVPESLMSPDYQDPMYDMQCNIPKVTTPMNSNHSNNSNTKDLPEICKVNKNLKGSPKLTRSAISSPKLKTKTERKGSLTKLDTKSSDSDSGKKTMNNKMNGVTKQSNNEKCANDDGYHIVPEKLDVKKMASNQRMQKKMSVEFIAAVTIQKMWRGYRSRNLNKETLKILQAIQAARANQHIQ